MGKILDLIRSEPVRALSVAAGVVPLVADGLIVFDAWNPTVEQLAYVNGAPVALGVALGWKVVRNAVAPRVNVEEVAPDVAAILWDPPQG